MKYKEIKKLSTWDMPDTVKKPDGYDLKSLPEATSDNMVVYMKKINELIEVINKLTDENNRR